MKKVLAMLLALTMSAAALTACSSSSSTSSSESSSAASSESSAASSEATSSGESSAASSEAESSEESSEAESSEAASSEESSEEVSSEAEPASFTTITDGVLTMGTNVAFPPYEYYDGETPMGIDIEICQAVADKLGLKFELVDMDFSTIITSIQQGKIDISFAGMTVTEERKQNVNFTDVYSQGVQVIIVKEDSAIASVDDLANAELIGVQESTTGAIYCIDDYGDDHVVSYTNGATAVKALVDGKVDCVVIDKQPALNYVEANEGLKILDTEYVVEDYAAAISKDNEALLDAVNGALQELTDEGKIQEILDKYIK